jgi:hypothetical protein
MIDTKVRIHNHCGLAFPYGNLSPGNKKFVESKLGEIVEVGVYNMNYYYTSEGFLIHVYNCIELNTD